MLMLIDCFHCRRQLQLPDGARSIHCAFCNAITHVEEPRSFIAAPAPSPCGNYARPPQPAPMYSASYGCGVPRVQPQPPSAYGTKRAVICGITYRNTKKELNGCINDAKYMQYLLVHRFKFPESSILMLTEEESDPCKIPIKSNIMRALRWLMEDCKTGDSLVFHYSGHGSQMRNYTGDEIDGYDETLCPLDFEENGMIIDDEINETIVRPLPQGAKLHAIVDACHSGTVLDLSFLCRMDRDNQYVWEDHRPRSGTWKGTNGGEAFCFSGCDDAQTSADTSVLSKVTPTGVMTYCFIQAIEQGNATTYGSILNSMRTTIRNTGESSSGGHVSSLITMLTGLSIGGLRQEPQLTSNKTFDVYRKPFSL
ncbi:metacaspase-1-like [Typha angustifolia]|uniref:metacaspase-1-like n=1 Tax=Typha angustifolia TaxID=59011 RepID=UPI003C30749C